MSIRPVIVVPVYKEDLSEIEQKALKRLYSKMSDKVQIIYVVKESICDKVFKGSLKIAFPDYYFKGLKTYSQLLISSIFWNKFLNYSHMLIHQMDCWLWGDYKELEFWCKMGYVFLGGPHFKEYNYDKNPTELMNNSMNGGFSLRDIKAHIHICEALEAQGMKPLEVECHEDTWWCGVFTRNGYRMPDPLTAARFAFEHGAKTLYPATAYTMPFGAHNPWRFRSHYPEELIDFDL